MRSTVQKLVFLTLYWYVQYIHGQTIAQINTLSSSLLSGYNRHTRPTNTQGSAVDVHAQFSLISIRDFDEVQEKLSTVILFNLLWLDESLVWDPSTNSNIEEIYMSQHDVWKPHLTLSIPHGDLKELGNKDWVTLRVNSSGYVNWSPLAALDSTCGINTKYYPYDIQTCSLQMYTFGYEHEQVNINVLWSTLDLSYYEGHATWKITSTSVAFQTTVGESKFLFINLKLERQPAFIIVNFLIPIYVLALLNPLVFLLPTDSGERIGFSITILLSLSVFLTILGDYIPQNSNPMSLCAFMLMSLYICSAVILLLVIISSNIYLTNETKPVNKYFKIFERVISCKICKRNSIHAYDDENSQVNNKSKTNGNIQASNKVGKEKTTNRDLLFEHTDWKDVSSAMDKVCFVFMYATIFLVISMFVSLMKQA